MKWIFTYTTRSDGSIEHYKAHLVVQGTQQFGLDFTEVWAPTGSLAAYRLLLTHAAIYDYDVQLLDIKCAFLNGDLAATIYASPLVGVDGGHIWHLRKAVYGLKQAARSWHACLRQALSELRYSLSSVDPALFLQDSVDSRVAIFTHVDDTAGTCPQGDKDFAAILVQFEGRHLGEIDGQIFLGILHPRDRTARTIELSQAALISSWSVTDMEHPQAFAWYPLRWIPSRRSRVSLRALTAPKHFNIMLPFVGDSYTLLAPHAQT
jgi:hypothetical protein